MSAGNHYIHLHWSDVPLPKSPFLGYAVPAFSDANKVILTGRGLKEATVREEAEFIIDGSQAGPGENSIELADTFCLKEFTFFLKIKSLVT